MDFKEFHKITTKATNQGLAKVRGSWGIYDAYKLIRKNGWYNIGRPLKEHEFYSIIRNMNKLLAEELSKGNTVVFPHRMGKVELRKVELHPYFVNDKLKIPYRINWGDTLKLWYNDVEAKNNKTLLRYDSEYTYFLKYTKYNANYENNSFYQFALNRFIGQALYRNVKKGIINDSLW